jgi:glycerol-3-phosphate dehydrogenase subunit B
MTNKVENHDLVVIGTGLTGMAAALFAAQRNTDTVQTGLAGQLGFASGMIDVLGVHPLFQSGIVDNPWEGIALLSKDEPAHPYARIPLPSIRESVQNALAFLEQGGYPHAAHAERNIMMMTPIGTLKPTYAVPHTMACGPAALVENKSCLVVGFHGLKGFSVRQITLSLESSWPALRRVRINFPGASGELYPEAMARALEVPKNREKLIDAVAPRLWDAELVAFPAILGISRTIEVMADLEQGFGKPVFEIPTMVPGVAGLRLREIFERQLRLLGITQHYQKTVKVVGRTPEGRWLLEIGGSDENRIVSARAVILCSGRFFGKGLHAFRNGVKEVLFNLPVVQPPDRSSWHHKDLLWPEGHPINRAGLAVDNSFRPVDATGKACYPNLFAAGSILANQDWMRQKCGSGLAIATASAAVDACREYLNNA